MITNKEALLGVINYPLPGFDFAIKKALTDAGLEEDAIYTPGDTRAIDLCAANLILFITTAPESISDNGFSISKGNREGLSNVRSLILNKYGLALDNNITQGEIHDASNLW